MSVDFIPTNDAAFDNWYKNFVDYVTLKTSGTTPQWKHIPKERIGWLKTSYERWHAAYLPCLKPHTIVETQTKNAVRKEEEKIARLIKKLYIDHEPDVNNADRAALVVPLRGVSKSPTGGFVPSTIPEITVDTSMIRHLKFHFKDLGAENRGKPKGVHGLELHYAILDSAPRDTGELTGTEFETSSPLVLDFEESSRGKKLYYCGRWESRANKRGPWGSIDMAVVP